jgi:alpha-glucosidase
VPGSPFLYIAILGNVQSATMVTRDGVAVPNVGNSGSLGNSATDAWYWNASINIVFVKIFDNQSVTTVSVTY